MKCVELSNSTQKYIQKTTNPVALPVILRKEAGVLELPFPLPPLPSRKKNCTKISILAKRLRKEGGAPSSGSFRPPSKDKLAKRQHIGGKHNRWMAATSWKKWWRIIQPCCCCCCCIAFYRGIQYSWGASLVLLESDIIYTTYTARSIFLSF